MPPARGHGFTLIEVLVALVIMAIMSLMAWQGVDGIVRSRDANQVRLEQTLRLQTVVAQWEQDLATIQESSAVPALSCDGQSVRLTRRAPGGLQVVAWSVRPDAAGSTWRRWAGPAVTTTAALQDSWLRTQQFQGVEPGQARAASGVEQWQVYFFRGNAWSNCQSTGDIPVVLPTAGAASAAAAAIGVVPAVPGPPGAAGPPRQAMPSGVRLVLSFAPGSGLNGSLVRDTLVAP